MRSSVVELISFFLDRDLHESAARLRHNRRELPLRLVDADPELAGMEICDDGGHASEMVGGGMSNHDRVEVVDAAIPQIGRDNLFSDIEVGVHPLGQAAGI